MKEKTKKFLSICLNILLVFLLLVGLIIGFSLFPIKGNYKIYVVKSGSMESAIHVGSAVVSKPADEYRAGDVITFLPVGAKSKNDTVTHRIISIENLGNNKIYQTKGDANSTPDQSKINQTAILGKYVFSIALIGYLIAFLKTPPGLILIIIIPAMIIIFEEYKNLKIEWEKVKKQRNKAIKKAANNEKNN